VLLVCLAGAIAGPTMVVSSWRRIVYLRRR